MLGLCTGGTMIWHAKWQEDIRGRGGGKTGWRDGSQADGLGPGQFNPLPN